MIPAEFLANIIANKADDLPRLIAADWLDDHGNADWAEFIRVQCELARTNGLECGGRGRKKPCPCSRCLRFNELCKRELTVFGKITPPLTVLRTNPLPPMTMPDLAMGSPSLSTLITTALFRQHWNRGFVNIVECTWQDWLTHADAILKGKPIERVRLTTMPSSQERYWNLGERHDLGDIASWLEGLWPGIEFELPRNNRGDRVVADALAFSLLRNV